MVVSTDHDQTAEKSSPSLEGVDASTEDHPSPSDGDEDGIIEERKINNKGSLERGAANLMSRSISCSAKIFSSPGPSS